MYGQYNRFSSFSPGLSVNTTQPFYTFPDGSTLPAPIKPATRPLDTPPPTPPTNRPFASSSLSSHPVTPIASAREATKNTANDFPWAQLEAQRKAMSQIGAYPISPVASQADDTASLASWTRRGDAMRVDSPTLGGPLSSHPVSPELDLADEVEEDEDLPFSWSQVETARTVSLRAGGPLSSHPVTPIESKHPGPDFPWTRPDSRPDIPRSTSINVLAALSSHPVSPTEFSHPISRRLVQQRSRSELSTRFSVINLDIIASTEATSPKLEVKDVVFGAFPRERAAIPRANASDLRMQTRPSTTFDLYQTESRNSSMISPTNTISPTTTTTTTTSTTTTTTTTSRRSKLPGWLRLGSSNNRPKSTFGKLSNDSTVTLTQTQTRDEDVPSTSNHRLSSDMLTSYGRSGKRPASRDVIGMMTSKTIPEITIAPFTSATGRRSGVHANTFPRLMRKKSVDMLSSARRKSGMFGRELPSPSTLDEDKENEDDWERTLFDQQQHQEQEADEQRKRLESIQQRRVSQMPLPVLPEVQDRFGGRLGIEEFVNIGR